MRKVIITLAAATLWVAAACAVLVGCTVQVTDSRLTREEVAQAFTQRDQVIATLAKEIQTMKEARK